jgi:hypothetical protein
MNELPVEAWMGLLERAETVIVQFLERAVEPPPAPQPAPAAIAPLERVGKRLERWDEGLARLEAEAAAIERSLAEDEEAISAWVAEWGPLKG